MAEDAAWRTTFRAVVQVPAANERAPTAAVARRQEDSSLSISGHTRTSRRSDQASVTGRGGRRAEANAVGRAAGGGGRDGRGDVGGFVCPRGGSVSLPRSASVWPLPQYPPPPPLSPGVCRMDPPRVRAKRRGRRRRRGARPRTEAEPQRRCRGLPVLRKRQTGTGQTQANEDGAGGSSSPPRPPPGTGSLGGEPQAGTPRL